MILKIDYDTVNLQKVTYDVIFMTLFRLCYWKYIVKMMSKLFSNFKTLS